MRRQSLCVLVLAIVLSGACSGGGANGSCGFEGGARCRPDSERVDLTRPSFSNPTAVNNPLLPAGTLVQAVQLGRVDNGPARIEVTRLPQTRTVEWEGRKVDTVVTQFASFSGGRIEEVALDYLAQADDGSVWYFGEKVANYKNGKVSSGEGSWLAGKDGPAGMLMPAHPKVGDVFRSENIPGLVFEEDTVSSTGETAAGPRGPVPGSVRIREHLMENDTEEKTYGPGYGEMVVNAGDEHLSLAVAVPTDAVASPVPADLQQLGAAAAAAFHPALAGNSAEAARQVAVARSAWDRFRTAVPQPRALTDQVQHTVDSLAAAVAAADQRAALAAIDLARAELDVEMRYGPLARVELGRMDVWVRQVLLDVADGARDDVVGDVASLEVVRDRVVGALDGAAVGKLDAGLRGLRAVAAGRAEIGGVVEPAERLRGVLAELAVKA
jgi:hypothetical protein